jgi:hypothetical protein
VESRCVTGEVRERGLGLQIGEWGRAVANSRCAVRLTPVTKTGESQRGDLAGRRRRSGNGSGDGSALTENGEGAAGGRAEAAERIAWRGDWGLNGRWGRGGRLCPLAWNRASSVPAFPGGPGRAARRAYSAAQARPGLPGQAGTGTKPDGSCRAWVRPKNQALCWAVGLRAACSSIRVALRAIGLTRSDPTASCSTAGDLFPQHYARLLAY